MSIMLDKHKGIPLKDIRYYLDGVETDRSDAGRLNTRAGQALKLRDQLLSLPDNDYEIAIRTIDRIIEALVRTREDRQKRKKFDSGDALTLFERTAETTAINKSASLPAVPRV